MLVPILLELASQIPKFRDSSETAQKRKQAEQLSFELLHRRLARLNTNGGMLNHLIRDVGAVLLGGHKRRHRREGATRAITSDGQLTSRGNCIGLAATHSIAHRRLQPRPETDALERAGRRQTIPHSRFPSYLATKVVVGRSVPEDESTACTSTPSTRPKQRGLKWSRLTWRTRVSDARNADLPTRRIGRTRTVRMSSSV